MKDPNRSNYFFARSSSAVSFEVKESPRNTRQIRRSCRFSFSTASAENPANASFSSTRCSEKGCVYPASLQGSGRCSYHLHMQEEPLYFRSHQPTGMLLDPARLTPSDKDSDGGRKRDRRRMADIWEQFQSDGTS
jgi:hypothetical protein